MDPMGGTRTAATLASCTPHAYYLDFTEAPVVSTWYPKSLAEVIRGFDPDSTSQDIDVDFNSDVEDTVLGATDFYY